MPARWAPGRGGWANTLWVPLWVPGRGDWGGAVRIAPCMQRGGRDDRDDSLDHLAASFCLLHERAQPRARQLSAPFAQCPIFTHPPTLAHPLGYACPPPFPPRHP